MGFGEIINLTNQLTNIEQYVNNKLVALVGLKQSPGISGFVFDIPQEEQITLQADITDHYTESNSYINDHIVRKPREITLTGLIAELKIESGLFELITSIFQSSLSTVDAYFGDYTGQVGDIIQDVVSTAVNISNQVLQIVNRIKNITAGFDGEGNYLNLQQRAFAKLEAMFYTNTLLTVQTPWKYFESMVIKDIRFSQGEETDGMSQITVTLKEWRSYDTISVDLSNILNTSRNNLQSSETVDIGNSQGSTNSIAFDSYSGFTGG